MIHPILPIIGIVKLNQLKKGCETSICLFECCFAENTIIKVLENNKEISKPISEIKLNDLVLTYEHGNKKYTKVNFYKKYEDDFKFYEIKTKLGDKVKTIVVTGNHIMICYDKNMSQASYLTAENLKKIFFLTRISLPV